MNSPPLFEKNLDLIIRRNMKGESSFSPLNFSPSYQQDNISRLKLKGFRADGYNPFFADQANLFNISEKLNKESYNTVGLRQNGNIISQNEPNKDYSKTPFQNSQIT